MPFSNYRKINVKCYNSNLDEEQKTKGTILYMYGKLTILTIFLMCNLQKNLYLIHISYINFLSHPMKCIDHNTQFGMLTLCLSYPTSMLSIPGKVLSAYKSLYNHFANHSFKTMSVCT